MQEIIILNHKTFSAIIERYQKPIIALLYKMVHSWETARDLAQDTFLKLWDNRKKIDLSKPLFTYLYKIAMNLSIDYLRKAKFEFANTDQLNIADEANPDFSFELAQIIRNCCSKLRPKQKAVFVLRDLEGMDFVTIQKVLNEPLNNIHNNLSLARKNIKNMLEIEYNITKDFFYD